MEKDEDENEKMKINKMFSKEKWIVLNFIYMLMTVIITYVLVLGSAVIHIEEGTFTWEYKDKPTLEQ